MAEAKQLLLIRHGKASWQPEFKDFDRPLTSVGEAQSRCLADWLQQSALSPDCWLVSAAQRTVQTADILRLCLGQQGTVQNVSGSLYLAQANYLLTTLQQVPESARCVALVGHNPGLSELLMQLAGQQLSGFDLAPDIMWPATAAHLVFTGNWSEFNRLQLSLKQVIHGKLLAKSAD